MKDHAPLTPLEFAQLLEACNPEGVAPSNQGREHAAHYRLHTLGLVEVRTSPTGDLTGLRYVATQKGRERAEAGRS